MAAARSVGTLLCVVAFLTAAGTACRQPREFAGIGEVTAVDRERGFLSLRHEGIAGLMGATTLQVATAAPAIIGDLQPGDRVEFSLQYRGPNLMLTRAQRRQLVRPGLHDHTPHHGGVVVMVGMIHLEALATPQGRVRVYLTDVWRRPLPLADVRGTATLNLADGRRVLPFTVRDEFLEALGPALDRREVNVSVQLERGAGPVEMTFQLPLQRDAAGAAGIAADGCVTASGRNGLAPRCALRLATAVSALIAAPQGDNLLIAAVAIGVTDWSLPLMQLRFSLAAAPPVAAAVEEAPHVEAVSVMVVSPDGSEVLVALESRILVYSMSSGTLLRELAVSRGAIRAAAWAPDGRSLLISSFYHSDAVLLDARDGHMLGAFPADMEAYAVAFSADGRSVAVGSEGGRFWVYDRDSARVNWTWQFGKRPVSALSFLDAGRIAVLSEDGSLAVWSLGEGRALAVHRGGTRPCLAIEPSGRRAAVGGEDGVLRIVDLQSLAVVRAVAWHKRALAGVVWTSEAIISGDTEGQVAVWNLSIAESDSVPTS